MIKKLLIGLDLSFNSTGISICYVEDYKPINISFHRVLFDKENNKSGKLYKPKEIKNINNSVYRMPTNINVEELTLTNKDNNNIEQLYATIRSLICSKKINNILLDFLNNYNPDEVICTMENFIMPSFGGPNSLKNVSGLLLLQGFVREFIIKYKLSKNIDLKLFTPTPTQNKKFFCGNGGADKSEMLDSFLNNYNGNKLLPDLDNGKIDDVIDSFALMCQGYYEYIKIK